jgi:4-hydroxybenzoate polyprenyltransferase
MVCLTAYLNKRLDWLVVALSFSVTAGTYLLNRVVDAEDKINNSARWEFFNGSKPRSWFWLGTAIMLLGGPSIAALLREPRSVALAFMILGLVGTVYSLRVFPTVASKRLRWISLKDIPVVKSLVVCATWAGGGLSLTVAVNQLSFMRFDICVLFLAFFVGTMNSTITADARDMRGDHERGLLTIPILLGIKGTFWLLTIVNAGTIALIVWFGLRSGLSAGLAAAAALGVAWAGLTAIPQYLAPSRLSKTVMELLVDSHVIVGPAFVGALWFWNP